MGIFYSNKEKLFLFSVAVLLFFGIFNMVNDTYGQVEDTIDNKSESSVDVDSIIEKLISQALPILGSILAIGFQYLRKHGIKISADAEKVFTDTALSIVQRQSKWIYEQLRDTPEYREKLGSGRLPEKLGKEAKKRVLNELTQLIETEKFTGATKKVLHENLPELVERMVTINNKELSERSRNLIEKLAPLTIDAILLKYASKEDAKTKVNEIINEAIGVIKEHFEFEEILFSKPMIEIHVKANLNKKIGSLA